MVELNVPFMEKEEAKRLGARWNAVTKRWYIPAGMDVEQFMRWIPAGTALDQSSDKPDTDEVTLSIFLNKISSVINKSFPATCWVSAEISELRNNRGHLYITLVEHDQHSNMIARISAKVWQTQVDYLINKFLQGTGAQLEAGIKVLIRVRVEFHAQYGMSLSIDDIDPSYTLGDMAAKLLKIREVLIAERVIDLNKRLPRPSDFSRVAVISPQNAAGLGDFNREAQILMQRNLCEFVYFTAQFQGERAAKEIANAIEQAIKAAPFDALVIIRGGGALSDLAWLNDEQLARVICSCPIHVMAGIGHERDYTIIDEVAGERFDTPSKVIQRIFGLITNNAIEADNRYREISQTAVNILQRVHERIGLVFDQLVLQAKQCCLSIEKQLQSLISEILSQSPKQILQKGFALVSDKSGKVLTSMQTASSEDILTLEFHDGKVDVRKF